ncbi:MAG TPA: murein biosynthesis integral membrane protein MurJ [Candidatus Cloacimonadota bacterium]|nr:murein biosynthesis integral membrane protein MurJ [Candidatus Cloacimonadota bacterium]HQB40709.1 murein biosynthesis integral membrane protein MurJ [Candidatus Cloacimonadota bacterium]
MTENQVQKKLFKNTSIMSIAVFLSRILGLVRDQVMAAFFGTSYVNDAFNIAFNIPNLLRRLFGEGALSTAFVPIYNEMGVKRGKKYQLLFAVNLLSVLSIILLVLSVLGMVLAPFIVKLIYPGLPSETSALAIKLTYILFPYLFFIGLSSTMIAILNSHDYFFITGLSSALLNIAWVSAVLIASRYIKDSKNLIYFAAIGVFIGGVLQTLINLPFLKKIGYKFLIIFRVKTTAMVMLWKRLIPSMLSMGVREINLVMDALIASFLPAGSISALGFGNRLMQLPLGVIGISAGTAALPSYSKSLINKDWDELSSTLRFSMLFMMYIMLPITALIIAGADDFIALLFKRGSFDANAGIMTVKAFVCYSLGLCFFGLNQTITPVFYAAKDTKTPLIIASIMCLTNILLNIALMFPLKHAGLALATSITAALQFIIMIVILKKRFSKLSFHKIKTNLLKIVLITIMLFAIIKSLSLYWQVDSLMQQLIKVASIITLWLIIFIASGFVFKLEYWNSVTNSLCKKFLKK